MHEYLYLFSENYFVFDRYKNIIYDDRTFNHFF